MSLCDTDTSEQHAASQRHVYGGRDLDVSLVAGSARSGARTELVIKPSADSKVARPDIGVRNVPPQCSSRTTAVSR